MNQGKALYELQEIDLAIIQRKHRLEEIATQLADNEAVQTAQSVVDEAEATLKPLQVTLRDIEHQVEANRTKRENTEKRLYSGSVTNPKELQDMQNEIASLKKWMVELEDRQLEAMVNVEEAQATLDEAQATLKTVMDEAAAENQDLLSEKQTLESELQAYHKKRINAEKVVDEANLTLYNTLRPQKANRPIAKLTVENACSACGIQQMGTVTKDIRRGEELIYCKNCKRILVAV